jgi:hypothetical protein
MISSETGRSDPKFVAVRNLHNNCHVSMANRPVVSHDGLLRDTCQAPRTAMPIESKRSELGLTHHLASSYFTA